MNVNANRGIISLVLLAAALGAPSGPAPANAAPGAPNANIVIAAGGRVTVELLESESAWSNALSLVSPAAGRAVNGCALLPADGLGGAHLLSQRASQLGCRVELDADLVMSGTQPFAPNTALEFGLCAQTDADPECEFVWSSNPANNPRPDPNVIFDYARVTPLNMGGSAGQAYLLEWEDWPEGGDQDFNDLRVVVRANADADGDGLWDDWEQPGGGIDVNGDGAIDLDLAALGASPTRKDAFVELDYMDCAVAGSDCAPGESLSHKPKDAAIQAVKAAFAAAPVANPDGTTGIALHVDVNNAIPRQQFLSLGCRGQSSDGFNAVKAAYFGPNNPRRFAFHYALFAHRQSADSTASGCAELPGNDLMVTLGEWNALCIQPGPNGVIDAALVGDDLALADVQGRPAVISAGPNLICDTAAAGDDVQVVAPGISPPADLDGDDLDDRRVGTVQQQAVALMHELGHNFGLEHGGDEEMNRKPNYLSVMNYAFWEGIPPKDPDGGGPLTARVDYSRAALPTLDETALSELDGIGDGDDETRFVCSNKLPGTGAGNGWINWSCDPDGIVDFALLSIDINGDDALTMLRGYDDWPNLKLDFQTTRDYEEGVHSSTPAQEQFSYPDYVASPGVVDLAVQQTSTPAVAVVGEAVRFTALVSNTGVVPASAVTLVNTLPAGLTYQSAEPADACAHKGQVITCTVPVLTAEQQLSLEITATVAVTLSSGASLSNRLIALQAPNEVNRENNLATLDLPVIRVIRARAFLPVVNHATPPAPGPDLVVRSINVTAAGVDVVIENIGAGVVALGNDFWVDLYINPAQPPTGVNQTWQTLNAQGGLVWGVAGQRLPLAPGAALTLRLSDVSHVPAESDIPEVILAGARIYVQVDSANIATAYGGVLESHELRGAPYNNISDVVIPQTLSTSQWRQRAGTFAQAVATHPAVARP